MEENWDSGNEEEEAVEAGERRRARRRRIGRRSVRSSDLRAPGIGFPLSGYVTFLVLSLVCFISFVTKFLAEGRSRLLPRALSPTFGAGRQTGKG